MVGVQGLSATDLAITRKSGPARGSGCGTRSAAFVDNPASMRVSEKLGYRRDGTEVVARRGEAAENLRLLLERDEFRRPDWTLEVEGLKACLPMLGVTPG